MGQVLSCASLKPTAYLRSGRRVNIDEALLECAFFFPQINTNGHGCLFGVLSLWGFVALAVEFHAAQDSALLRVLQ